jgi:RNA polymerase sigma factor (sigma-70 family)
MLIDRRPHASPAGVAAGFDALFVREYPQAVAIAYRVLLDRAAAEDVAQDAFVHYHRLHAPDAPFAAAWLHRAALHGALNALRAARRRTRHEEGSAVLDLGERAAAGAAGDPLHAALRAEERAGVRRALARLSERHRAVLALRYSGLSYAETAAALGIKAGHVGTLLARAEAALTKEIDHDAPR